MSLQQNKSWGMNFGFWLYHEKRIAIFIQKEER